MGDVPQNDAAAKAGMTPANFRVQLHRLRGRYRQILRQEISATLEHEEEYEQELEYLFRISGRPI
jgi:RNA polymerase sigma-70 factor (ECF subfamily)